jgi:cell shape-determining protein MreC
MTKRILAALLLVAFGLCAGVAVAADAKVTGKVLSVEENSLKVEIQGEKAAWIKKNAPVKFENAVGKVLEVSAEGVTPVVVTIKSKKASSMKAGDTVTFEKGRSMAGC